MSTFEEWLDRTTGSARSLTVTTCRFLLVLQRAKQAAPDRNTLRATRCGRTGQAKTRSGSRRVIGSIGKSLAPTNGELDLEDSDAVHSGDFVEGDSRLVSYVPIGVLVRRERARERLGLLAGGVGTSALPEKHAPVYPCRLSNAQLTDH